MSHKVGDKVKWLDGTDNGNPDDPNRYGRVTRYGVVREVLTAELAYPNTPSYKPSYRGERKDFKFPKGTKVLRVEVETDKPKKIVTLVNLHEEQLIK